MEIERKFVLRDFPGSLRIRTKRVVPIKQYYCRGFRVRKAGKKCFLTVKNGKGLVRSEWECTIPVWVFETLRKGALYPPVTKKRHLISHKKRVLEVDVYEGRLASLLTLECEFGTRKEAERFELPEWAEGAVEVTGDDSYTNRALAKNGVPKRARAAGTR